MKRRISDMLNGYQDDTVKIESVTPLSSERIKELTMSKITKKEKKSRRIGFKLLVAAAIIASLTMTVYAAEEIFGAGDWFREILSIELQESKDRAEKDGLDVTYQETISEGQIEVINQLGKVFEEQTYTDQGTTVTLTAVYADENIAHLYLQVEAPEGTVLPDGILYRFCNWEAIDLDDPDHYEMLTVAEDAPYDRIYGYSSDCIEALPDEDPADNKKDFHITITGQPGQEMKFNDGYSKYLNIDGIYQQVPDVDGDDDGYVLLAPGKFSIDFGITNDLEVVELDVAGLTYGGLKTRTWTHNSECSDLCAEELTGETDPDTGLPIHAMSWNYSVTATKLTLSPLSAEWACEYTVDDETIGCNLAFQVVLKDGTTVANGGEIGGGDNGSQSYGTRYFAVPIDLDEVDYVLIGDPDVGGTYKVYLP